MIRNKIKNILFTEKQIRRKVKSLARKIIKDAKANMDETIVFIMILNGAFVFVADLIREVSKIIEKQKLPIKIIVDSIDIHRYGDEIKGNQKITINEEKLRYIIEKYRNIKKIICDDLADEGYTLNLLYNSIGDKKNIDICILLEKNQKIKKSNLYLKIKYSGFSIPDEYVVGYGMGKGNESRELPYVASLDTSKI